MDDLAHQCPRKRKQDQDDCQEPSTSADPVVVAERDPSNVAGVSCNPPNTPRRPWLAEADDNWTSPTSPQVSSPLTSQVVLNASSPSKRLRVDTRATKRHTRRSTGHKMLPSPLTTTRQGSDIEDIGIVSTADPGPSSGSLLRDRRPYETYKPHDPPDVVQFDQDAESPVIDFSSPHMPPCRPLINRSTLKELELDIILRNPVIRHDLLFDPGLQFRPRRKRERFERYWNAVWEELHTGCTCITVDQEGVIESISGVEHLFTIRQPSRIPALLEEFLEVMVFVIQPLSNTAVYTDPTAIREQAQEHSAHAAYLRSIFDPQLITQELKHKVFDPSGLFRQIGDTLKHHCAPMRDRAVEEMVQMAQRPGLEAFKAVRTCLELLELMKLDIANHQLTQLRPWLLRNTGIFEVKAFKIRFGANASLHNTRRWLHSAHHSLLERPRPIFHPSFPTGSLRYSDLRRNQQIYLSALKGIVDLIFDVQEYPAGSPTSSNNSPPLSPVSPLDTLQPSSPSSPSSPSPSPSSRMPSPILTLPETLYLDKARILPLSQEAVSTTALYMFMLLFRQLVFSSEPHPSVLGVKVDQSDMFRLKREIRDIGPACLGVCFEDTSSLTLSSGMGSDLSAAATTVSVSLKESRDLEQLKEVKEGLVLHVAKRACDTRNRTTSSASSRDIGAAAAAPPDQAILGVAQRWANANMQAGSALTTLVHKRMRDAVFDAVVCLALPGAGAGRSLGVDLAATGNMAALHVGGIAQAAGMEAMTDEIRRLAEDTARLALIHLNTHLPLYEGQGFFPTRVVEGGLS